MKTNKKTGNILIAVNVAIVSLVLAAYFTQVTSAQTAFVLLASSSTASICWLLALPHTNPGTR